MGEWTAAEGSFREAIESASSVPETATVAASFAAAARQNVLLKQSVDASAAAMALICSAEAQLQGPKEKARAVPADLNAIMPLEQLLLM